MQGGKPQYWNPISGQQERCESYKAVEGGTEIALTLAPAGSTFVVFGSDVTLTRKANMDQTSSRPTVVIKGPWKISFPEGRGAPASVVFDELKSWTKSQLPGVRCFSGIATYDNTFDVPASLLHDAQQLSLDLGDVKEMAEVYLNGKSVGTVWTSPYCVDISQHIRPGPNELKIEVANLWANRIIGDYAYPQGGAFTHTNMKSAFNAQSRLLPSGLLGPVRIYSLNDEPR